MKKYCQAKSDPQQSVFVNKLLKQLYSFVYVLSIASFMLPGQSRVVAKHTVWPTKTKIYTIGSITVKVYLFK